MKKVILLDKIVAKGVNTVMKRGLGLNLYIVYIIYPIFIYAGGNSLYIYIQYIQGRIQGEGASNPGLQMSYFIHF